MAKRLDKICHSEQREESVLVRMATHRFQILHFVQNDRYF